MRRVLVVDDDPVTLMLLTHILQSDGFEVYEANDVSSAVASIAEMAFDAVVCDFELPDGSGLDIFEAVEAGAGATCFVLVTGHQERSEFADARIEQVEHFLPKPVSSSALLAAVARVSA